MIVGVLRSKFWVLGVAVEIQVIVHEWGDFYPNPWNDEVAGGKREIPEVCFSHFTEDVAGVAGLGFSQNVWRSLDEGLVLALQS